MNDLKRPKLATALVTIILIIFTSPAWSYTLVLGLAEVKGYDKKKTFYEDWAEHNGYTSYWKLHDKKYKKGTSDKYFATKIKALLTDADSIIVLCRDVTYKPETTIEIAKQGNPPDGKYTEYELMLIENNDSFMNKTTWYDGSDMEEEKNTNAKPLCQ